jgi:hypothetical protein
VPFTELERNPHLEPAQNRLRSFSLNFVDLRKPLLASGLLRQSWLVQF